MKNNMSICPICDQGNLHTRFYGRDMQHKGVNLSVEGLQIDCCPDCGAEVTSPAQLNQNAKIIRDAFIVERERVKHQQKLLTGAEIRRIREYLCITQKQASKIFGGGPTAFAKYEAEDVVQSAGMDKLIRLASEVPIAAEWLFEHAGEKYSSSQAQVLISSMANTMLYNYFSPSPLSKQQHRLAGLSFEESDTKIGRFINWHSAIVCDNEGAYADAA